MNHRGRWDVGSRNAGLLASQNEERTYRQARKVPRSYACLPRWATCNIIPKPEARKNKDLHHLRIGGLVVNCRSVGSVVRTTNITDPFESLTSASSGYGFNGLRPSSIGSGSKGSIRLLQDFQSVYIPIDVLHVLPSTLPTIREKN